jgi:iron complex outermembrane recepter protein
MSRYIVGAILERRTPSLSGWICALTLALLMAGNPGALLAQGVATVSGTVQDATGLVMPRTVVELRDPASRMARTEVTNARGAFEFSGVEAGSYEVVVRREGFRPLVQPVNVDAVRRQVVNLALERLYVLEQVVVSGTRTEREVGNIAAAVTIVDGEKVRQGKGINLEESLRRVPGLTVQDELGTGQRTRIIVRGTGTRANGSGGAGVRGVRVMVDGIPKNNAGGSAQDLTNIDLESVGRIEVIKGPASALYGNQSGGVVNLVTRAPSPTPTLTFKQTIGAYGLFREHLSFGGQKGNLSYVMSAFRTDQDGFREHSAYNRAGFHSKFDYPLDPRTDVSVVFSFDRNIEESPGPLTAEQFALNPRQADPDFVQHDFKSTIEEMRFGATFRRREILGLGQDELEVVGFYVPRHLGPFTQIGGRLAQDFTNRGATIRYLSAASLGGLENRFTVGFDFHNTPITTGSFSTAGAPRAMLEENSTVYGVYVLEELALLQSLRVNVGARYDNIRFSVRDLARQQQPKLSRTFERVTPKVGVTFRPVAPLSLYANYSGGFETPTIGEMRTLPGGQFGFNAELAPQRSTNYEVGARGQPASWLSFESAVFRQVVHNLISPIGTAPNASFQNVGRVRQTGFEVGSQAAIATGLDLSLTYTYSDFIIEEFRSGDVDFTGNELPGIPPHNVFAELSYRHPLGIAGAVHAQHVSRSFADNANTATIPEYTVFNLRGSVETRIGRTRLSPFLGINNLTDEMYSAFTLLNDQRQRYYNPLPGRHLYGGMSVSF